MSFFTGTASEAVFDDGCYGGRGGGFGPQTARRTPACDREHKVAMGKNVQAQLDSLDEAIAQMQESGTGDGLEWGEM